MAKPKLSVKTPDASEYNTLISTHEQIIALPRERRYAIVELKTEKVENDIDSGEAQAKLQIIHVEQPRTAADEKALTDLLDKMFTSRTKLASRPDPHAEQDTPLEGLGGLDDSVTAGE